MNAARFLDAVYLATYVAVPLAFVALYYDWGLAPEMEWKSLRKRLFIGVLLALAAGTVTYAAVPIPNPDWCATLDSWWWLFYGCWLA